MQALFYIYMYFAVAVVGYQITALYGLKNVLGRFFLGVVVGTGVITYLQFLLYATLNIRFTTTNLLIIFTTLLLISLLPYLFSKTKAESVKSDLQKVLEYFKRVKTFNIYEKCALTAVIIICLFRFMANSYWPITDWDALALYDFRAKVFVATGGMEDGVTLGYFFHYPPYTSLLHSWNYLLGSQEAKTWYAILFTAFLGSFYYILRKETTRTVALLGTFFLCINQSLLVHAGMAYTNLPYAIFIGLGYLLLLVWLKTGERSNLLIGSLLIALSTWIRLTEPFWLMSFIVFVAGFIRWRRDLFFLLGSLVTILFLKYPWVIFTANLSGNNIPSPFLSYYVSSESVAITLPVLVDRLKAVLLFFFNSVFPVFKVYILPLLISLLYSLYTKNKVHLLNFFVVLLFVGTIVMGMFLFSFQFPGWAEIPDSATRMSMFLLPLIIFVIMTSDLWKTQGTKRVKK